MSQPTQTAHTSACTTRVPDRNGYVPPGTCGYHGKLYFPSFTLAAIFTAVAATILLGHMIQLLRFPEHGLQRLAVFISTCLVVEFAARTAGTKDQQNIYLAAISDTVVLAVPILINVLSCAVLHDLVRLRVPDLKIQTFKISSIVRLLLLALSILGGLQLLASTALLTGNPPALQMFGIQAYRVLIGTQGAITLCIILCALDCHLYGFTDARHHVSLWSLQLQKTFVPLYVSLTLALLRVAYRSIELAQIFDPHSTLPHKEVYFYLCDTIPTFGAIAVWIYAPADFAVSAYQRYQRILDSAIEYTPTEPNTESKSIRGEA